MNSKFPSDAYLKALKSNSDLVASERAAGREPSAGKGWLESPEAQQRRDNYRDFVQERVAAGLYVVMQAKQ